MKLIKNHKGVIRLWKQLIILWFPILVAKGANAQWSKSSAENDRIVVFEGNQTKPVIASDGSDGAIIAWQDDRNTNNDIYTIRIQASGKLTWSPNGKPVVVFEGDQQSPSIIENGLGGAFIAWQDNRNNPIIFEVYAQQIDNFFGSEKWSENGEIVQSSNSTPPRIIRDSIFGVIVATYTPIFTDFTVLVQKLNSIGRTRWGPRTPANQNPRISAPRPTEPPAIISDLNGGAIIAWPDIRDGNLDLYAAHINQNGILDWPSGEVLVTSNSSLTEGTTPAIIPDPDSLGGVIIAWISPEISGSVDFINVQKFNSSGQLQWGNNGKIISQSSGRKRNVKIARVKSDTLLVLWVDLSSGADWDISAQLIKFLGNTIGPEIKVVDFTGDQVNPFLSSNKKGAVIVAWEDNRSTDTDIYAQLIEANGRKRWEENDELALGTAISTAINNQKRPVLIDDGLGGAIIVWEDFRNGNDYDIYAQRISAPGQLGEFREIDIITPNGNEIWEIGSSQVITWTSKGEIDSVSVELSRNGGQTFEVIFKSTPNSGSTIWKPVLDPASSACKIRIRAKRADFIMDVSDQNFTISNPQGPTIQHTQISQATDGDSLLISAEVRDLSGVAEVFLNYRQGGAQNFVPIAMLPDTGDNFSSVIAANSVTERGLEYYISSIDSINQDSNTDTFFVSVNFGSGVQTAQISGGTSQSAYRMISSPNLLEKTFIDSIFSASGFGAIDTTSWRVFLYQDTVYVELDSTTLEDATFTFEPGKAFWLISNSDNMINYGSGVSLRSDTIFTITLDPGWNQIGLPFAFPVAWNSIFTTRGEPDVDMPWLYTGSYAIADTLEPFEGYFVQNRSNNRIDLKIPPIAAEASGEPLAHLNLSHANWALQIEATCQEALDDFNFLGVYEQASDSWDALDHTEPPPIGEYVSVYFPHKDWQVHPNNYTTDFRTPVAEGQTWSFIVNTNIRSSEAKIVIMGIETLPHDLEIILLDEKLNISQDLREDNVFVFPTGAYGISKNLKILVGDREFVAEETSDKTLVPVDFELSQNFPNPFNPVTSIRFGIPHAEKVRIQVFDILGKEVTTLIDNEQKQAGYHLVSWNGKDRYGSEVASGLYIYRLQAGKFSQTKKMLLIQ